MSACRLLSFVASATIWVLARPVSAADASPTGDAMRGRALFIGAHPLSVGGPPCGACHAIGGAGASFAAALGPELSRSFEGMTPDVVDGLLQELPFPTVSPLYTGHALAPGERADLAAFLLEASGKTAPGGARVAAYAALVAAACLVGMGAMARRSKGSTRAELLAKARLELTRPRRWRDPPPGHGDKPAPPQAAPSAQGEAR